MSVTQTTTQNAITLKGSSQIISEYLSKYLFFNVSLSNYFQMNFIFPPDYGINSILFQRGIYPPESFVNTQQYGLTILMSRDNKIEEFLKNVLSQTQGKINNVMTY